MQLLEYLQQNYPEIKRTSFKRLLLSRRITVNGQLATRLKQELAPADKVAVTDRPKPRERPRPRQPEPVKHISRRDPAKIPLRILYEDLDLMVVLKPAGLLTSTNERETRPTLAGQIREYLAQTSPESRIGIIHRLDKDASGLLVFTKRPRAYHHLKRQLFARTVDRVYTAVIEGIPTPKDGRIQNWLLELPTGRVVRTADRSAGQIAITDYELLAKARIPTSPGAKKIKGRPVAPPPRPDLHKDDQPLAPPTHLSLLRIKLHTGRKHQIRAHFSLRKTPILGDRIYGRSDEPDLRLLLAATTLAFDHPYNGQRLTFEIEPPKEIVSHFPNVKFKESIPKPHQYTAPRKDPANDTEDADLALDDLLEE